jgi:isopentenyl diphosphate isomerase/L-lactate dehydrogenase-like FMN-dependent dehydrogenase
MSPEAFAYVAGGAGTGATMRANRAAFDRWRIVPRMLRDVSERDTSVELGRPYVYGLALAGEAGVREVVTIFIADFDLTRGLAGCHSMSEIGPEALVPAPRAS